MQKLRTLIWLGLLIGVLGACDDGGSSAGDADGGVAVQACAVQLPTDRAQPGDLVSVVGPDLGEAELAIIAHADALAEPTSLPATYFPEAGELGFFAPAMVETMDAETRFRVELHRDGQAPCGLGALTVAPLPEAGDTTLSTVVTDLGARRSARDPRRHRGDARRSCPGDGLGPRPAHRHPLGARPPGEPQLAGQAPRRHRR